MAFTFSSDTNAASPVQTARARTLATYRNLALWTLQGWIAMFFIAAGYAKLTESMDNLITLLAWPALVSASLVRGVGIVEIVLALGILAPLVSWRIGRPLLIVSAAGLVVLEAVMLGVHALSGGIGLSVVNVILLGLTIPVLWGRRA
jgi:hypothetical protein